MDDITIPDEALEAAQTAYDAIMDGPHVLHDEALRAACLAMLRAWPGMHDYKPNAEPYYGKHIILPLPVSERPKMDRKAAVAERLFGDD